MSPDEYGRRAATKFNANKPDHFPGRPLFEGVVANAVRDALAEALPDAESLGWLRTLIGSYRELRQQLDDEGIPDEDESATGEMLSAVTRLADRLDPPRPPQNEPEPTDWFPDTAYGDGKIPF